MKTYFSFLSAFCFFSNFTHVVAISRWLLKQPNCFGEQVNVHKSRHNLEQILQNRRKFHKVIQEQIIGY
jgi:hypothetical protein